MHLLYKDLGQHVHLEHQGSANQLYGVNQLLQPARKAISALEIPLSPQYGLWESCPLMTSCYRGCLTI